MKNTNLLIFAFVLVLNLTACGTEKRAESVEIAPKKRVQVEVLRIESRDLQEEFTLPGSLEAWKDLRLAAEVAGPIEWVGPEEGDQIAVGEKLVQIDSMTLKANRDSVQSDYELRKKTLARLKRLTDEQLVSYQEYDNALSSLDMASAALRSAELMLAKGTLKSPLNGLLEERYVEPGEYIGIGDPLVRVVQVDRLKINVDVPEKDVQFLRKGAEVTIQTAEIIGRHRAAMLGRIIHIGYVADPVTRTYRVRLELDNSRGELRPGMIVRTKFLRRKLNQVIAVPLYAVVDRDGKKFLFLQDGELAEQRPVELGAILNGDVVIQEGLHAGELVVVKGQQLLQDKTLITAVEQP